MSSLGGFSSRACFLSISIPPMTATTAIGTLTYRHQRQDRYSVRAPPSIRPMAPPPPEIAPKIANALARSAASVNVTVSSDSAAGARRAPKMPCATRAETSISKFCAAPPIADAAAKPIRPVRNMGLRPIRSLSRPPSRSSEPNARAYPVTIHCRLSLEKPSDCCAVGSAMFTIVASSTTMSWARAITPRISQRVVWCGLSAWSGGAAWCRSATKVSVMGGLRYEEVESRFRFTVDHNRKLLSI